MNQPDVIRTAHEKFIEAVICGVIEPYLLAYDVPEKEIDHMRIVFSTGLCRLLREARERLQQPASDTGAAYAEIERRVRR